MSTTETGGVRLSADAVAESVQAAVDDMADWAREVAVVLNNEQWSSTRRLVVWNEFKRIVEKEAFAR